MKQFRTITPTNGWTLGNLDASKRFTVNLPALSKFRDELLTLLQANKEIRDPERLAGFLTNLCVALALTPQETGLKCHDLSYGILQREGSSLPTDRAILIGHTYTSDNLSRAAPNFFVGVTIRQLLTTGGIYDASSLQLAQTFADFERDPPAPLPPSVAELTGIPVLTLAAHDFGNKKTD